jgi:hypothetical protein
MHTHRLRFTALRTEGAQRSQRSRENRSRSFPQYPVLQLGQSPCSSERGRLARRPLGTLHQSEIHRQSRCGRGARAPKRGPNVQRKMLPSTTPALCFTPAKRLDTIATKAECAPLGVTIGITGIWIVVVIFPVIGRPIRVMHHTLGWHRAFKILLPDLAD